METTMRNGLTILFVFSIALLRLIPHPPNLVPMTAICLFAGSHFKMRLLKWTVPLVAILVTDLIGFQLTEMTLYLYLGYALIVATGRRIEDNAALARLLNTSICGTLIFFVVSNFGFWQCTRIYAPTLSGLGVCYIQAIPFLLKSVVADAFYVVLIFTAFRLIKSASLGAFNSTRQVRA